jgi:D-alanyl-D-alanine carboxypeptidase
VTTRRAVLAGLAVAPAGRSGGGPQAALQGWLDEAVERRGLPGAVAAIRFASGVRFVAAAGWADREARIAMTSQHRFLGASIGKTFVSALCLRLQRQGVLRLDDPLAAWLGREPWFSRLPNGPDLTLRRLLNHSSGLRDFIDEPGYAQLRRANLRTDWVLPSAGKIALILDTPALFPAGRGYAYADTNYILAGMCVERAAGRSYYGLIREAFLTPLGLRSTAPATSRRLRSLAIGYAVQGGRYAAFGYPDRLVERGRLVYNPATEWTGGGLVTTPADLTAWLAAVFEGRATHPHDVSELWRSATPPAPEATFYYGQGMHIFRNAAGKMIGHLGSIAGYSGFAMRLPAQGITIAMQANLTTFDRLAAQEALGVLALGFAEEATLG